MQEFDMTISSDWRDEAGAENPAGPLFSGGAFAEADIVGQSEAALTQTNGTICTNASICC